MRHVRLTTTKNTSKIQETSGNRQQSKPRVWSVLPMFYGEATYGVIYGRNGSPRRAFPELATQITPAPPLRALFSIPLLSPTNSIKRHKKNSPCYHRYTSRLTFSPSLQTSQPAACSIRGFICNTHARDGSDRHHRHATVERPPEPRRHAFTRTTSARLRTSSSTSAARCGPPLPSDEALDFARHPKEDKTQESNITST